MNDENVLVDIKRLNKKFIRGRQTINVLNDLDLKIHEGDFVALMGASGSGKSTLLNLIGGLDSCTSGSIGVRDQKLENLSQRQLTRWRADNIGFVFQLYHLIPVLNARKNIELPLLQGGFSKQQRNKRVDAALALVGLTERADHKPNELSGGQEQRVGIARAIVKNPAILLCDEPTGDLDFESGERILELLQVLNADHNKTIVMVTHDSNAAEKAKKILHLKDGSIERRSM